MPYAKGVEATNKTMRRREAKRISESSRLDNCGKEILGIFDQSMVGGALRRLLTVRYEGTMLLRKVIRRDHKK